MRFKRSLALEHRMDMTPVVDVVFNLLIFFMLTSPFVAQAGIPVKLPEASAVSTIEPARIEIAILASDVIMFEGREMTIEQLERALRGRSSHGSKATIFADRETSLGAVLRVRDACFRVGLTEPSLRAVEKRPDRK